MDGGAFDGGEAGEPVAEAARHRRRVTGTRMLSFSPYGVSQERHVGVILLVADGLEKIFIELRHEAVAVADGEDNRAGGHGLTLLSDVEFQHSRLAGGVNDLHDLLSPISQVVPNAQRNVASPALAVTASPPFSKVSFHVALLTNAKAARENRHSPLKNFRVPGKG